MRSPPLFVALILLSGFLTSTSAWAQYDAPNPQQNIPKEEIQATGTLKGIRNGVLYVLTEDGGQWVVNVERDAKQVAFVGSADATWLRPGMFVEFSATVNARGESTAPVNIATVMTPTKENPPGVASEAGGAGELFEVKDEKEKAKEETYKVRVVGQITGIKEGMAQINGGNAVLKIAFDPAAKIAIELPGVAGMQLVRPGNKVEFGGWYVQNNKGQAWANRLSVSSSEPFTNKKTPPAKPKP